MLFLNLITKHGVNNLFVDELFALLRLDLFPKDNILPKSMYHAKKVIQWLGLSYNSIHVCYNGCMLFKGEFNDASTCPKCNKSWYIEGLDQVPCKVLWHFSLIPSLKQLYRCSSLVKLMSWHHTNKSHDGMVHLICDSKVWKHVDITWPNFATDPHNTRLGLALIGWIHMRTC